MKFLGVILGFLLLAAPKVYGGRHCKTEKGLSYAQQLARLDPKFDLDLVDLDFFPGGSLVAGYEYQVDPAHTQGLYGRTDRWQISTKAIPVTDIGKGIKAEIGVGVRQLTEATFTRFFSDPCSAMLSTPYSPRRIPLTSKIALSDKYKVGDYFQFRGSAGFVVSAELLSLLGSSVWGVGLSGNYLIDGFYQLQIVKLDATHFRFKILAHRGSTLSASVGLGYENEFDVFSINSLNNQLEKFVNTKPLKIKGSAERSKLFMVDYILDLSDKDVARAFEKILLKVKNIKNIKMVKAYMKDKDLDSNLLLDLSPLEELYQSDRDHGGPNRIKRNLKTTSNQNAYNLGIYAGNKILGLKYEKGVATARMSISQESDVQDRYLLKSWDSHWEGRLFYSWIKSQKEEGLNALFTSENSEFSKLVPINIVKFMKHKKNRFTHKDFLKLKKKIKKALPDSIYKEIPWENWPQTRKIKFTNYGLRYELLLAPETVLEAPPLSVSEIEILFSDYLASKELGAKDYFSSVDNSHVKKFRYSLRKFAKVLSQTLDRSRPLNERVDLITDLRRNKLFAESGLGFLMVLRPDKMKSWYHLDFNISSDEAMLDYSYGEREISTLYKKILTIKAALDDDELDLIREAESLALAEAS